MNDATPQQTQQVYRGSWKIRRRIIYSTLLYCAGVVLYLVVWGSDTALHQQIALSLVGLSGAVIGSYVFGAVWDDHSIRRFGSGGAS